MNITMLVGQNIRDQRKRKGVKLEALADKLQIDKSTLSKMETGRISITIERIGKIAEVLEIDFDKLIALPLPSANETGTLPGGAFVEADGIASSI